MAGGFEDRIPDPVPSPTSFDIAYGDLERGEALGRGGNADVHRATVEHDGEPLAVALKEPRFQGTITTTVVERFVDEAETWASIDGDEGIVGVVDWGTEPLPWLALEYMDGGSLADRVGDLETPEATWIGVRMAEAVHHAHRHGVAHLDLKPANVLFRETPGDRWDFPKVSDWGLARMMLDSTASVEGLSPQYAAPEQFAEEEYGAPDDFTDSYQLGAVVYELVTGEPPFSGSAMSVMRDVLDEPPVPPTERAPELPPAFDDVLGRALAKEKADRYESVLYLRDALEGILATLAEDGGAGAVGTGAGAGAAGTGVAGTRGTADSPTTVQDSTGSTAGAAGTTAPGGPDSGADGATDDGGGADGSGGLPRRRLLQGGAVAALAAGVGGATVLGIGDDGGDGGRNELDGAGADPTPAGGGDGGESAEDGGGDTGVEYDGWFDDTSNFEGTVDATGESEVRVAVGAEGNGGPLAFEPAAVRVDPGTTVHWEWTGEGGQHGVHAESGAYESEVVGDAGAGYTVRFGDRGVSKYYCPPHEALGMKGAVVVGDADGTEGEQPAAEPQGGGGGGTPTSRELRQGVLLPLSGALGDLGEPMADAALLPVRQIEDLDAPVSVTAEVRDTETDADIAVEQAASLADDGFPAVTGPSTSEGATRAADRVFRPEEVVGCTPSATTPELSSFETYAWRTVPSDTFQARALAQLASDAGTAASVLAVDVGYGRALAEVFASAFEGTVQTRIRAARGQDSYASELEQALADDPDTLLVLGYPEFGIQALRDYYAAHDPSRRILVPDGMKDGSVPDQVDEDLREVRGTAPLSEGPGRSAFVELYRSEYGADPGVFTAESYDATAVCLLANVAAGANDGPTIAEAIPAVTSGGGTTVGPGTLGEGVRTLLDGGKVVYEGAASPVEFDANGDLRSAAYEVFGYDGGGTTRFDTIRVE